MRIRRACPEDALFVAQGESLVAATPGLLNASPGEIPDRAYADKIAALGDCANGLYLVAEQGDEIVGHLLLDPMPLAANSHICTLTVVVYPKWQGRGFGRQLLVHALQWAGMTPKVRKIELMVRATNERAVHLYKSLGFLEEGRIRKRVKTIADVYLDDIAMGLFMQHPGA